MPTCTALYLLSRLQNRPLAVAGTQQLRHKAKHGCRSTPGQPLAVRRRAALPLAA